MLAQASNLNQGDWAIMFVSKDAYQEAIQRLLDHNEAQDNLIQAKDATIAALTQDRDNWRSRALEDAWPFEWQVAGELKVALDAKDKQIAALVTACKKFSGSHDYHPDTGDTEAWVDPQDWAEFDAAIKEVADE